MPTDSYKAIVCLCFTIWFYRWSATNGRFLIPKAVSRNTSGVGTKLPFRWRGDFCLSNNNFCSGNRFGRSNLAACAQILARDHAVIEIHLGMRSWCRTNTCIDVCYLRSLSSKPSKRMQVGRDPWCFTSTWCKASNTGDALGGHGHSSRKACLATVISHLS